MGKVGSKIKHDAKEVLHLAEHAELTGLETILKGQNRAYDSSFSHSIQGGNRGWYQPPAGQISASKIRYHGHPYPNRCVSPL